MVGNDIAKKVVRNSLCGSVLQGNRDHIFAQSICDNKKRCAAIAFWKSVNKIHGDFFPDLLQKGKWLQESL
jgi:hypothetical protein